MKNQQEKLSLHGLWLSVSSSSSPPSRPSFNSIRELDSVVASGLAAATGSLLWPPPPQPLGLIDSWDLLLRNEIIEGEEMDFKMHITNNFFDSFLWQCFVQWFVE